MLENDLLCLRMAAVDDIMDLLIDLLGNFLTVASGMGKISADKHLVAFIAVCDQAHFLRHTVLHHHCPCGTGGTFDIIGCSCSDISEDDLLGHTAAQKRGDILKHFALRAENIIILRKGHGVTRGADSRGDDGYGVYRIHVRKHMEQDRMARLMISCDLL